MRRILVLLALVSTGLACSKNASVSESQCAAGDWETIGYRDGALGYRSSRLLAHQDACIPHGVTPDREAYQTGWRQGIEEFCDPANGFEVGQSGEGHGNVCPAPQRDAFLAAFDRGRTLFVARDRVDSLAQAIAYRTQRIEAIGEELVVTASAQLNPMLLPDEPVKPSLRRQLDFGILLVGASHVWDKHTHDKGQHENQATRHQITSAAGTDPLANPASHLNDEQHCRLSSTR